MLFCSGAKIVRALELINLFKSFGMYHFTHNYAIQHIMSHAIQVQVQLYLLLDKRK